MAGSANGPGPGRQRSRRESGAARAAGNAPLDKLIQMTTTLALEARGLCKSYGSSRGILDIDLQVAAGSVVGLVGANGAGKTTLMRTLLDFIRPTSGSVQIFGLDSVHDSLAVRRRTAYLPGELTVPRGLTGQQTLQRYAFARGTHDRGLAEELAERLGLDLARKVGDLSKGNKQKVGLVLAFSSGADLLVLDEPTSGLDPLLQRTFGEIIGERTAAGATVLLSSHVMSEVEHLAHSVAVLEAGRLVAFDDISVVRAHARRRGRVRPSAGTAPALADALSQLEGVDHVEHDSDVVTFQHVGADDAVIKALARFEIVMLDLAEADLEDAFFSPADDDQAAGDAST